jgi:hypothetical protein
VRLLYAFSFFLEKKRNKKFKENTTAPRVFPGLRSAKASRLQFAYIMDWHSPSSGLLTNDI